MNLDKVQGRWQVVSVEVEGQKFPPGGSAIVVTGNRFVSLGMGGEFEGTIECGERTFDLCFDKGLHAGKKSLGIYDLTGGEWKMCLAMAGAANRPERFVSRKGTGHALQILRRQAEPAPAPAADPSDGKPTELEGEWAMTSCVQDGQAMSKNFVKFARRVFSGDRTTLSIADKVSAQSRIRVHAGEIDYIDLGQKGIYELSDGALKISMASPGAARPKDFSAATGDGRTVTEWKFRLQEKTARSS